MERRGSNTWLVAGLAIAVGFLAALLIFGRDPSTKTSATIAPGTTAVTEPVATTGTTTTTTGPNGATTSTTTAQQPAATPQSPQATPASCIDLWNQPANRGPQTFLVNVASQQPVRVNVGTTTDVPPQCLVTIVANNGDVYTYPEGGGTTFPYATSPGRTTSKELPVEQKNANALDQRDGTLKSN
jgi:hypothetical protein